jgi:hypothetical protein
MRKMTYCLDIKTFITSFIEQNHRVMAANSNDQAL